MKQLPFTRDLPPCCPQNGTKLTAALYAGSVAGLPIPSFAHRSKPSEGPLQIIMWTPLQIWGHRPCDVGGPPPPINPFQLIFILFYFIFVPFTLLCPYVMSNFRGGRTSVISHMAMECVRLQCLLRHQSHGNGMCGYNVYSIGS